MSWFLFALICLLGWGFADMFYKKSSDEDDKFSHLKIAVWVGLVMGVFAIIFILVGSFCSDSLRETIGFAEEKMTFGSFWTNLLKYSPAAIGYIVSMVIGYAGLRYLELSIISPVQNASGALSAIAMLVFFLVTGSITNISEEYSALDWIGTAIIVAGVIALAIVEQQLANKERKMAEEADAELAKKNKKYKFGALALLFPIGYCIFDTIGTAADGIILDETSGLGLGEMDVIILYGITFFIVGLGCWIYMFIRTKKPYNPFTLGEVKSKGVAALCEEFGQIFYVFAMAANPVIAAPMIASYCIVSIILSRIFLKEKMKLSQYICVAAVVIGIVILGISEGLAEL